jgi:hypothetical protein
MAAVSARAAAYATGELVHMALAFGEFGRAVAAANGDEAAVLAATLVFSRRVEDALASAFTIGHCAGLIEQERPLWLKR